MANPDFTGEVHAKISRAATLVGFINRIEDAVGIRFGCMVDELNTPYRAHDLSTGVLMEREFSDRCTRLESAFADASELSAEGARLAITLPLTIPGHRNKAVVGVFDYFPLETETEEAAGLLLARKQIGRVSPDAPNPYYAQSKAKPDPTWVHGAGAGSYLRNQGYVSGGSGH